MKEEFRVTIIVPVAKLVTSIESIVIIVAFVEDVDDVFVFDALVVDVISCITYVAYAITSQRLLSLDVGEWLWSLMYAVVGVDILLENNNSKCWK